MPGRGFAYSTRAAVTALPMVADFAFHFSDATSRYEFPQEGCEVELDGEIVIRHRARIATADERYAFFRIDPTTAVRFRGAAFFLVAVLGLVTVLNSEGSSR